MLAIATPLDFVTPSRATTASHVIEGERLGALLAGSNGRGHVEVDDTDGGARPRRTDHGEPRGRTLFTFLD